MHNGVIGPLSSRVRNISSKNQLLPFQLQGRGQYGSSLPHSENLHLQTKSTAPYGISNAAFIPSHCICLIPCSWKWYKGISPR